MEYYVFHSPKAIFPYCILHCSQTVSGAENQLFQSGYPDYGSSLGNYCDGYHFNRVYVLHIQTINWLYTRLYIRLRHIALMTSPVYHFYSILCDASDLIFV